MAPQRRGDHVAATVKDDNVSVCCGPLCLDKRVKRVEAEKDLPHPNAHLSTVKERKGEANERYVVKVNMRPDGAIVIVNVLLRAQRDGAPPALEWRH